MYKPTSPGQRGRITTARDHLWKGKPFKALTKGLSKSGGRNNHGRITVWHRGGGHKRKYRMVDFQRLMRGVTGVVRRIEAAAQRALRDALGREVRLALLVSTASTRETIAKAL